MSTFALPFDPQTGAFTLSFAGVKPATGGQKVPTNYYRGLVDTCTFELSKDKQVPQYVFKLKIQDPEHPSLNGATRTTRVNVPLNGDAKFFRAALESCGMNPAQLDQAGPIQIQPGIFVNRPCTFYYEEGDKDAGVWDACTLLDPTTWATRKAAFLAGGGAGTAGGGAPAAANPFGGATATPPARRARRSSSFSRS